jgi:hypothetical protein
MRAAFNGGRPSSLGSLPTARSYNRLSSAGGGGLPTSAKPPPFSTTAISPVSPARARAAARRRVAGGAAGWVGAGVALLLLASLARRGGSSPADAPLPLSRLPPPAAGSGSGRTAARAARPPLAGLAAISLAADALASAGHAPPAVRAAWRAAAVGDSSGGGGIRDEAPRPGGAGAGQRLAQWEPTTAPPAPGSDALAAEVGALVTGLRAASAAASPTTPVACPWDATLRPGALIPAATRVLLAADARDFGPALAPHWVLQAATLLALLPAGGGFLSVYESGSTDGGATGAWLGVARSLAAAMDAPARVIAGGRLTRAPGTDRIAFLASARNRALEPLWLDPGDPEGWDPAGGGGGDGRWSRGGGGGGRGVEVAAGGNATTPTAARAPLPVLPPGANATAPAAPPTGRPPPLPLGPPSPLPPVQPPFPDSAAAAPHHNAPPPPPQRRGWPADRVLFINDAFFCAGGALRLLAHTLSTGNATLPAPADVACGLDFDRPRLQDEPLEERAALFAARTHASLPFLPRPLLRAAARAFPATLLSSWAVEGSPADRAYQAGAPLGFYDIWVARDADGRRFGKAAPYAGDAYSIARLSAGLPFPATCCWNGMVALPAAPFREGGLRMRAAAPGGGECAASECSLLCNDLLRLGHARFLVDPAVRLAYTPADAAQVGDPGVVLGMPAPAAWGVLSAGAAAPPLDWGAAPARRPYWEACCLPPGADAIHWDADCGWDDWAVPDWTAVTRVGGGGGGMVQEGDEPKKAEEGDVFASSASGGAFAAAVPAAAATNASATERGAETG